MNIIDAYIDKSEEFAQPILHHLRKLVHEACPEVVEKMKWSFPVFEYKGRILCNMAAFKKHCSFGFWLANSMSDPLKILEAEEGRTGMGQLGKIQRLDDLPDDNILISYIHEAMQLTDSGAKLERRKADPKAEIVIPEDLQERMNQSPKARATFEKFSNSNKREYVEWINGAKTEPTRLKRLDTTIEWLEEGKVRNWKYLKC